MARWSDLAEWRGPTPNQGGPMIQVRGLVIHIAAGFFEGTIAWQHNEDSNVSSHFMVGRDGRCAQLVDTDVTAWTQSKGNGHWLSSENEGFLKGDKRGGPDWYLLSPEMIETNAQLLARAHHEYGVPLQLATHPDHRGLGYHSMGAENGINWGHDSCPGEPIKAQLPLIVQRAIAIVIGGNDDMDILISGTEDNFQDQAPEDVFRSTGNGRWLIEDQQTLDDVRHATRKGWVPPLWDDGKILEVKNLDAFGPVIGGVKLTPEDLQVVIKGVAAELRPAIEALRAGIETDTRDAVADLGEGGSKAVRADLE